MGHFSSCATGLLPPEDDTHTDEIFRLRVVVEAQWELLRELLAAAERLAARSGPLEPPFTEWPEVARVRDALEWHGAI